jgi:hypothetical protein
MTEPEAPIRNTLSRVLEHRQLWLCAAVLLVVLHFARFFDPNGAVLTDTRYFTYFATLVADGGVPHLDFFDNKTQLASLAGGVLVKLGRAVGGDALVSIRIGYLGLTALGGVLAFLFFRLIGRGNSLIALLGALPYLGFTYIGALPATGNVPKLIMIVAATGAALAVARRRWWLAGAVAAIAPMDWQIGLFVCIGVVVAAQLDEERRTAVPATLLGGTAMALLFVGYFGINGALEPFLSQTIAASFERGASAGGPLLKLEGIERRILWHAGQELWLVALAVIGMGLLPRWLFVPGLRPQRGPIAVLAVYHYGVVGFSLIDFQGSGDTMLLLHSLAFFAGVSLIGTFVSLARLPLGSRSTTVLQLAMVGLVLAIVRPAIAVPAILSTPDAPGGLTLHKQLEFVERLRPILRDKRLVVLGPSELLMLGEFEHESIFVFWNTAAAFEYQRLRGRRFEDPLADFIAHHAPDVIIANRYFGLPPGIDFEVADLGQSEEYPIKVWLRRSAPGAVDEAEIDRLRALGYVSFSDDRVDPGESSVKATALALETPGYYLFNSRKPPSAQLIDQRGRVVHSWNRPGDLHWSNVELLQNGDLLVPSAGVDSNGSDVAQRSLTRFSWDGRELWRRFIEAHHDVEMTPSGDIAVLTYRQRIIPEISPSTAVRDVSIVVLEGTGIEKAEHSLYSMLAASPDVFRFQRVAVSQSREGQDEIDLLHANSLEVFGSSSRSHEHPMYAPGNVLVSIRHQDTIAIFDLDRQRVVWSWGQGVISGPHDATLLENGNILLFDNGLSRNWSRVIELDPRNREIVWEYRATPPASFYTRSRGSNQRLPDGNTLIANSDNGQAFIVTPEGEVVWQFLNPNAGPDGRRATIVRIKQYPAEWIERWVRP